MSEETMMLQAPPILVDDYKKGRVSKEIIIFPANSRIWTFTQLLLFLNSLEGFKSPERYRVYGKDQNKYYMIKFDHQENTSYYVRVSYNIMNCVIEVYASLTLIEENWKSEEIKYESSIGTQMRKCLNTKERKYYLFTQTIDISKDSSTAIMKSLNPFFYSKFDFTASFYGFVSSFCRCNHIPWIEDSNDRAFMYDFFNVWVNKDPSDTSTTYEKFINNNEGYFKFIISETSSADKECFSITRDDKDYSILSGVYISPFAKSMCIKNAEIFDGLLMDATWKTIDGYVTSILMASICNVGVPLGFAFGPAESKDLYEHFYKSFNDIIDVDLSNYVTESDGGSALSAITADKEQKQLTCHHHYLRSLKTNEFSHQVGALTSCQCSIDLENLLKEYSKEFARFTNDDTKFQVMQKTLATCGMCFNKETNKIEIFDAEQWDSISLIERVKYKLPTTTNALESSHGHLNSKTPRRNDFYTSLSRLISFTIEKTHNFKKAYQTNFNRAKRKIFDQCSPFYEQLLIKESAQYNSTKEKCDCGETVLLSAMMRVKLPCSHMIFKGAKFPEIPNINLQLENNFNKFVVEYEERKRTTEKKKIDLNDFFKQKASATIRKFTSCKKLKVIEPIIKPFAVSDETTFASKMPLSYYSEVSNGIHKLHDYKKKKKASQDETDSTSCDETEKRN